LNVKSAQNNVKQFGAECRLTANKSVGRSHAPQEIATNCREVGLQVIVSTVGLLANKYTALNHEWNITGNYAVRMHKILKH